MKGQVLVAGGGMAGMAAAMTLAERGQPVQWLAPPSSLGDKPGESLAAAAEPLLDALGLGDLLSDPHHRRVEVTFSSWGSDALLERHRMARPGGLGHVVGRIRLEAAMAEALGKMPAVQRIEGAFASVRPEGQGWRVTTEAGEAIDAVFLIDATGRNAAIGREFASLERADRLVAACAFLERSDPDVEPTPATIFEAVGEGWWYATLLADGRLAVNYYTDPDLLPRGLGQDLAAWRRLVEGSRYIAQWVETGGFDLSTAPRLASAGTTWLSSPTGKGWVAVGDAAAAFDPLSAHGMTTALWTGIEAGKAVADALEGSPAGLEAYRRNVESGLDRYRKDRRAMYRRETRFTGRKFWHRRQAPEEITPAETDDQPASATG